MELAKTSLTVMAARKIWSKDKIRAGICDVAKGDMVMEK
jgi:hypothetical protein